MRYVPAYNNRETRMRQILSFVVVGLGTCLAGHALAKGGSGHSSIHTSTGTSSSSSHTVAGHVTKNGTYVAPHQASNPNATRNDNFSTKGNVNPYTGKEGTKPRDGEAGAGKP